MYRFPHLATADAPASSGAGPRAAGWCGEDAQRALTVAMATENGQRCSELDGQAPESTDYANYFCTYSFIYHQVRTGNL